MQFLSVLLPVFGIFLLGFVGQKKFAFDLPNLSRLTLYLMSPFLCFEAFYKHALSMNYVYLALYTVVLCFAAIALVYAIAKWRGYATQEICALILSSAFMNSGNYGVPVVLLAFGAAGLDVAVVLMVMQSLIMNTVGIYYAAKGSPYSTGAHHALRAVLRMPIAYAALGGIACQALGLRIPDNIMTCVSLVGSATIPTVMILLGMQLAMIRLQKIEVGKVALAIVLKLLVSPLIALGLTLLLPVDPLTKQIMILIAGMPTAANTTLLAVQFNTRPDLVSAVTFLGTLLSLITLSVILWAIHL